MDKLQKINTLLDQDLLDLALAEINEAIAHDPTDDSLHFLRGKLHWRLGNQAEAMTDYARAVELNPDSPARRALEQSRDIMDFFNPDLLNP